MGDIDRMKERAADRAGCYFDDWWDQTGKCLDPDTSDVPWFDKRKGLAELAFRAALALSGNYVADDSVYPQRVDFANGRFVTLQANDDGPYLGVGKQN